MTIEIGSVVRLKSGGPWMTVTRSGMSHDDSWCCEWFSIQGLGVAEFPAATLVSQEELHFGTFADLAKQAYCAYGDEAEWKNYQGKLMPDWDDLPENIRRYWHAATVHIVSIVNSKHNNAG